MIRVRSGVVVALLLVSPSLFAQPAPPAPAPAQDATRGDRMRAYHDAMARRRLGSSDPMRVEQVAEADAAAEGLIAEGRNDEAIAKMTELVVLLAFVVDRVRQFVTVKASNFAKLE